MKPEQHTYINAAPGQVPSANHMMLNVAAEQHDLTAPCVAPQLNVEAGPGVLTGVTAPSTIAKLSELQKKILLAAAQADAVPMRELVRRCFGKVAYSSKRRKYQAAYASTSRAVRKLRNRALLQYVPIHDVEIDSDPDNDGANWWYPRAGFGSWVRLTDAGIEAVKSACSVRSFNQGKAVKSIPSWTSFSLPAIRPVRFDSHLSTRRHGWIRVFYHRPAFDSIDILISAVRKEFQESQRRTQSARKEGKYE